MILSTKKNYKVIFYEDKNGKSQIEEFLIGLEQKSLKNKDARIQYRQTVLCIDLLSKNGTNLSNDITKNIDGAIWELRPGKNRILYFFFKDNKYVLLHQFAKKTQKTPKREIIKAKSEMLDYIERNGK